MDSSEFFPKESSQLHTKMHDKGRLLKASMISHRRDMSTSMTSIKRYFTFRI